jgi:alkylated DNA repair dioxygenase AlkB
LIGQLQPENHLLAGGGKLQLLQEVLSRDESDQYLQMLRLNINWRQDAVRMFGREHQLPRLHQWFGDPDAVYRWSGLTMLPETWPKELASLRVRVEQAAGASFNSVLANWYRDGQDSMGWHADDEPELGAQPIIASLSLGAERDFVLRYRDKNANVANLKLILPSGSLLIMSGSTQLNWQHALPRRKNIATARINLTFRKIH